MGTTCNMDIKVEKVTQCVVSIPLVYAAELIREELNLHGSRQAKTAVSIPGKAEVVIERIEGEQRLIFRWVEDCGNQHK